MSNRFPFAGPARLASQPGLSFHASGAVRSSFRIAVDDLARDENDQWVKKDTVFYDAVAWGAKAEKIAATYAKGDPVIITGDLDLNSYEDRDGKTRMGAQVKVDHIGPNTSLCDITIDRTRRGQARENTAPAAERDDPWASAGAGQQVPDGPQM